MIVINLNTKRLYKNIRKEIGRFLFIKRQEKNWSLKKVALLLKICPETLENVELGRGMLRWIVIVRLLMLYQAELRIRFVCE